MSLPARLRAFGISKALDYLERDPDANLPKLMDWLDKYTGERLASPYRELFHRARVTPATTGTASSRACIPISTAGY